MGRKIIYLVIGIVLIIIGIIMIAISLINRQVNVQIPINSTSPSYLLLSNWRNLSIYISTGYPIPKPALNGESSKPPSILQILYGKYGLLGINITITNLGSARAATWS